MKINHFFIVNLLLAQLNFFVPTAVAEESLTKKINPAENIYQNALNADSHGRFIEAMNLSREAAMAGNPGAQSFYGYLLDKADFDEEAEQWYRKASAQNDIQGILYLASLQAAKKELKATNEALDLYHKAVQLGSIKAIQIIAMAYIKGDLTLEKNNQLAFEWFSKAVEKKDISSIMTLANSYEKGDLGLTIDAKKALQLYHQASELNSTSAAQRLQRVYLKGELGEKKDPIKAKFWQNRFDELVNKK